jgi:uncharacterized membrane protein
MTLWAQLRQRPRLLLAILLGAGLALAWPQPLEWRTRLLLGWNVGLWTYLPLVLWMMMGRGSTAVDVPRRARELAEGLPVVLLLAIVGAIASLGAITLELSAVKHGQGLRSAGAHFVLALTTVVGSWLLLPVEFALAYASLYHRGHHNGDAPHGLEFPGAGEPPDYGDFLYFSITIAATSQTSDVAISARHMRRLVLLQSLLAFAFNTGVLALTINILASLLS